jgi:hypothetical protein
LSIPILESGRGKQEGAEQPAQLKLRPMAGSILGNIQRNLARHVGGTKILFSID